MLETRKNKRKRSRSVEEQCQTQEKRSKLLSEINNSARRQKTLENQLELSETIRNIISRQAGIHLSVVDAHCTMTPFHLFSLPSLVDMHSGESPNHPM